MFHTKMIGWEYLSIESYYKYNSKRNNCIIKILHLLFSGKRSCIGESFIMMQAFLLLATIIQNFHLSLPEGEKITIESFYNSNLQVIAKPRDKH